MTVRTRIAPSPTGDPHVGTAYIALFNLAFARSHGGKFILRIEDTDQVRSDEQSEKQILDALRWLGLEWDEGPDIGGPYGPYHQSQRKDIYQKHAEILLEKGHAFHCFCSTGRLTALRDKQMQEKQQPGYDGHCMALSADDVRQRRAAGESSVVRMKVPREGRCKIQDTLRGEIDIEWAQVDMQILMKADGMPTYHLANVVDDHLMAITHIIRGEEWISSAPKHKLLYEYFAWDMPQLCHMPLLRNPDKSKLSKRKNPTSILYYQRMGFLPEALCNYLGRMGWSMPDEREKFSFAEMVEAFDIQRVSLGGPIFDLQKLSWLNGQWLRALDAEEFSRRVSQWAFNADYFNKIAPLIQNRVEVFTDIAPMAAFFVSGMLPLSPGDFENKDMEPELRKKILQFVLWRLEALRRWERERIEATLSALSADMAIKLRQLMMPVFVAVTGKSSATPLMDSMTILGPDMTRARIRHALEVIGGVSKKELKQLEKDYKHLGAQTSEEEQSHQD